MRLTKITDRTIMLTVLESPDATVNLALVLGAKHNFIIDTGVGSGSVAPLMEYIDKDKPIVVILTHKDWDHVYGNCVFEDMGCMIVAHTLCRQLMDEEWDRIMQRNLQSDRIIDGEARKCLPNVVFDNSLHFQDEGISLFHTPFHTEDGISVYDAVDKILHIGDNFGFKDGKAYPWGKCADDFKKMIDSYKKYDFNICLSGHCEPQTRDVIAMMEASFEPWQKYLRENNEAN